MHFYIISIYAFFFNLAPDLDHADRFVCPHICIKILASNPVKWGKSNCAKDWKMTFKKKQNLMAIFPEKSPCYR